MTNILELDNEARRPLTFTQNSKDRNERQVEETI